MVDIGAVFVNLYINDCAPPIHTGVPLMWAGVVAGQEEREPGLPSVSGTPPAAVGLHGRPHPVGRHLQRSDLAREPIKPPGETRLAAMLRPTSAARRRSRRTGRAAGRLRRAGPIDETKWRLLYPVEFFHERVAAAAAQAGQGAIGESEVGRSLVFGEKRGSVDMSRSRATESARVTSA